jgi:hypothetical protein
MFKKLLLATVIAGSFGAVTVPASAATVIVQAPPAPRVEVVPAARRGYVWAPGHWNWQGHRHVWVRGSWVRERPGQRYEAATWVQRDGRWYQNPARWTRGMRDRDGDGVPNRFDSRPNDPTRRGMNGMGDRDRDGVPNRYDSRPNVPNNGTPRDRDGDGVPNRLDARPDNPNRS